MSTWQTVIGLEVHVQLATQSKAFSASAVDFGAAPNSLTDPTVLGLPGALPVFNRGALEHAVALGLAVGGTIRRCSRFARKQYFYPDLPKGYQISQYDEPLVEGGAIEFRFDGEAVRIPLTRIHLEEDAGKSTHQGSGDSLVDLNRAGVPLCEVVSEPAIYSADHAAEYMRALRRLVRTLGIGDGDMEKGQLRCDANVSIRRTGDSALGVRTEIKNINSFKFVKDAIEFEARRHQQVLEDGGEIVQETRLWDADAGISRPMRSKEEALDYRYFPDPDLPPLVVDEATIERIAAAMPELPEKMRARLLDAGVSEEDAAMLVGNQELGRYFDEALAANPPAAKTLANWICGELVKELSRRELTFDQIPVSPPHLCGLLQRIEDGTISGTVAKKVLSAMFDSEASADEIIEREGLKQISDSSAIEATAREIIAANPKQVEQYRAGKTKLIGFFVGQVMKKTQGRANPQTTNEIFQRLLSGDDE